MQINFWNKSQIYILIAGTMILAACGNEETFELQSGDYTPGSIEVVFNDQPDLNHSALQQSFRQNLQETLERSLFTFKAPAMEYLIDGEKYHGIITPENLILSNLATFHIKPLKEGSIEVLSYDYDECQPLSCQLKFTLNKVTDDITYPAKNSEYYVNTDSDESRVLENGENADTRIDGNGAVIADNDLKILPELPNIPELFSTKFWGVEHEISDQLTLKLSPSQSNGLIYGIPEHTDLTAFEIAGITIDPNDPEMEMLSFYSNREPSSEIQQVNSTTYLFLLPESTPALFDFSKLISESTSPLFENPQHLLIADNGGYYAVYYRDFPEINKSVIALTESMQLEDILLHMQAIDTLKMSEMNNNALTRKNMQSPSKRDSRDLATLDKDVLQKEVTQENELNKTISLNDIALPLKTIEARYQISLMQMFRQDVIEQFYQNEIKRILSSQALFLNTGDHIQNGYHQLTQFLGDYRFNETYVKLHPESLDHVITSIQALNNHEEGELPKTSKEEDLKGLWLDPIYIYSKDPITASGISYLKEIQPGITLEIFSPAFQGHIAEKVLFAKLLEQLSWKNIPKIPKKSIPNIAKYSALEKPADSTNQSDISDTLEQPTESPKRYRFKEGETDLQGNILK